MNPTTQPTSSVSTTDAARTLGRVLTRAKTFTSPALLVAEFPSERVRRRAAQALSAYLSGAGDSLVDIDLRKPQDLFQAVSELTPDSVASIHGLHAQPEVVRRLNWRREFFTDNNIRAVFWLNFEELKDVLVRAPDFWAFRNRHLALGASPQETPSERTTTLYRPTNLELSNLSANAKTDRIAALEELLTDTDDPYSSRAQAMRNNLSQLLLNTAQYHAAIYHLEKALDISREVGDQQGEGVHLSGLGHAYAKLGEGQKAIEYYQQALDISREIGDRQGEGANLGNLGNAYANLGEVQKAVEHYQQALDISREVGDRQGEGVHLNNLGTVYAGLGEGQKAIACWIPSFFIFHRDCVQSPSQNAVLHLLAELRTNLFDFDTVLRVFTHLDFDTALRGLFPDGDTILREATGQDYDFYRTAPPTLPDELLARLNNLSAETSS